MPGRSYSAASQYRYGFNGKENDKDIGEGGQDYGMRINERRIGRFLSVDPLIAKYPELTPYQFASNTPIQAVDLDGAESMFGWSIGLTPKQTSEAADSWNRHNNQLTNGAKDGVIASVKKTWKFVTSDAWKAKTWKEAGKFIEESALGMSSVPVVETPRVDAAVKNFSEKVVHGNTYTRSKFFFEFGTDIVTGYGIAKGISTFAKNIPFPFPASANPLMRLMNGEVVSILGGKGNMSLNLKTGLLEGSFTEGMQTVQFDATVIISEKTIDFTKVGIYGQQGFGTVAAQNLVKPSSFKQLLSEIEDISKASGFEEGSIQFERRRPDGSALPDSKPRAIPLDLKKE